VLFAVRKKVLKEYQLAKDFYWREADTTVYHVRKVEIAWVPPNNPISQQCSGAIQTPLSTRLERGRGARLNAFTKHSPRSLLRSGQETAFHFPSKMLSTRQHVFLRRRQCLQNHCCRCRNMGDTEHKLICITLCKSSMLGRSIILDRRRDNFHFAGCLMPMSPCMSIYWTRLESAVGPTWKWSCIITFRNSI
jgi:hypothetical protein